MSQSPFWNEDWMNLQKNYWEKWTEMSKQATGFATPPKSPWEQSMDHWWQAVSPKAQPSSTAFMEKMMEQGKQFFRMTESLKEGLDQNENWSEMLNGIFEKMRSQMQEATHTAAEGMNKGAAFWQSPMENWQKFAGKAMPFNFEANRSFDFMGQLLGAPGLGYSREIEEQYKKLMQAGINYQAALADYNQELSDLGPLSVDRLQKKVKALADSGNKIESARQLYDLWVSASEEVYAERTMTAKYSEVHGGVVNALMAFKKQWQDILDNRLAALGMPTQREIHTTQDRLQQNRREMRSMERELASLKKQVAELSEKVATKPAAAQPKVETAAPKAVTRKKAVTKKKVTKKKATPKSAAK